LASRAAAVRVTRASSATVPNRRLRDSSTLSWTSVVTGLPFSGLPSPLYLHLQIPYQIYVHMQIPSESDPAELFDRLVEDQVPGGGGLKAWGSLLRAHASLMRRLDMDLERETGLALADFDVLAQLARAHGELRMTELADRVLISRSGMSRRVARLVDEGLVRREKASTDARGVVVALTKAGLARLAEAAPVHARGISKLFVAKLDDQELALLERALKKVIVDCSFG
jgi:DNA-binding MarR family transcriptional regulator